jgi:hypothetical protein
MYKRAVIYLCFVFMLLTRGFSQSSDPAEAIKNNIQDYINFGYLNINFSWQFDKVAWDHGKSYHHKEIAKLENKLVSDPDDISACVNLLYLYEQDNLEDKTTQFADEC